MTNFRLHIIILLFAVAIPRQSYGHVSASGETRCVVIGISDYQDEGIPDLQYAHRDAEAFANYLLNHNGEKINPDNVQLITNEQATGGQVHKALNQLIEISQANDKVIIYFAGHGDVETIDEQDSGHLLLYDTPANTYQINSLRVDDLKKIVAKLSEEIGSEVILITDACRSGNLAGQDVSGAQATTNALNQVFANETKILSCQADEFSMEGSQWGGGRGVFSLHLVEGLTGLADKDGDSQVTLRELQRYLEDNVEDAVAPSHQSPEVVGDKRKVVSFVDEDALVQLIQSKSSEAGYEEFSSVLASTVDLLRPELAAFRDEFYESLQSGYFIPEDNEDGKHGDYNSASEIYDQMVTANVSENQLRGIKADFIAALQDDAQAAINSYLKAENELITEFGLDKGAHFKYYSAHLDKATFLLGQEHYLYAQMLAKKYYFESIYYRLSALQVIDEISNYKLGEESVKKALLYDSRAAYIYNELGLIYTNLKDTRAVEMYQQAIIISPNWAIPLANIANRYLEKKEHDKAEKYAKMAMDRNPKYVKAYKIMSDIYSATARKELASQVLINYNDTYGDHYYILEKLGEIFYYQGDNESAIEYFTKSLNIRPNYGAFIFKGLSHYSLNDLNEAEKAWVEAYNLYPNSFEILNNLGWVNQLNKKSEKALNFYKKAIEVDPLGLNSRLNAAKLYFEVDDHKNALKHFAFILDEIDNNHSDSYLYLAKIYAVDNQKEKSYNYFMKAVKSGALDIPKTLEGSHFDGIRESEIFKSLIKNE